jgi:hypothetical protein
MAGLAGIGGIGATIARGVVMKPERPPRESDDAATVFTFTVRIFPSP